ncbi:hypothetical protein POUND7_004529 [Theobroma cacao]
MAKRNFTEIWNFTNPGVLSHNEILEIYRDYINSNFTWKNFTLEEQAKVLAAPRCNNELDSTKLKQEFPKILPIKESAIKSTEQPSPNPNSSSFTPLPELILPGSSTRLLLYSPRPRGHTHNAIPSRFSFPGDLLALVALWP